MRLLRCLGPFQLEQDGQALPLPTRKDAALFAYLVLHPAIHLRQQVATRFWGEAVDEKAQRSLRTALSTLRKVLGHDCLLADRETVQFNPAFTLWTDALILREQAQRFLAAPTPDPSLVDVTLYRGDLLEGLSDDWILREREELRLLYLRVLLRLAQHWRTQGDYAQTSEIAHRILALDAAEETAHQHLIFCYMVSGDSQAARQQHEACVRALRDELDVEPSPETVALYRRSQQVQRRSPSPVAAQTNLPIPLASFVGRRPEIAKLKTLLGGNAAPATQPARLVTITGPGGCGKTRLAIQVAREVLDAYRDGIWWVEFAALSDENQVPQAVAKVLDVQQGVQTSLTDVLITYLRTKQALLVLDNCEHLVVACAELAERLLSHCPDLQILATSREALGIFGETSWLVPSLTLPSTQPDSPTEYLHFEAIHLFVERAGAAQRDFALNAANAPAILQICRQLDGIPLAIELAAVRVKLMTVEQIATRLTNVIGARFDLLTDGGRTVLPRQQTLRATMAWSYTLLGEQEQRLLQQFSIFAGGWSLEAAEATGAESGPQSVATVLARLVDKSLVLVEPQGVVARYQMLETVRQYAYKQLERSGEIAAARDRHLSYFLQLAERAEPELRAAGQLLWLRRLEAESENLRIALIWGLQHEPPNSERLLSGSALATALIFHWKLHSDWLEGRFWLQWVNQMLGDRVQSVEEVQRQLVISLRAKALYGAGVLVWHQEKWDESRRLLDGSAELAHTIDNQTDLFRTQIYQAQLFAQDGDLALAYKLWNECTDYFRSVHDLWFWAETVFFMGYAERRVRLWNTALRYYQECCELLQKLGERWLFSLTVSHLGLIAQAQGDYATAWTHIEQRLMMGREFGLKQHMYAGLDFLGDLAQKQGNLQQAAKLFREALVLKQRAGVNSLSSLQDKLGIIALDYALKGQDERALRLLAAHRTFGSTPEPEDLETRNAHEKFLAKLQTQLGMQIFSIIWGAGAAMTPEQAVEEALAER